MDNNQMPAGLAMALAQDVNALDAFTAMSKAERSKIIEQARAVNSSEEMRSLVSSIVSSSHLE